MPLFSLPVGYYWISWKLWLVHGLSPFVLTLPVGYYWISWKQGGAPPVYHLVIEPYQWVITGLVGNYSTNFSKLVL